MYTALPFPGSCPRSFCPFRFLHGRTVSSAPDAVSPAADSTAKPAAHTTHVKEEGRDVGGEPAPFPPLFGFGKHMCPGRELAKLELVTFLQRFLGEFDYHLVEGQVRSWCHVRMSRPSFDTRATCENGCVHANSTRGIAPVGIQIILWLSRG